MSSKRKSRKQRQSASRPASQTVVQTSRISHAHFWRVVALWAMILAAYSNSFSAGFVFDNQGLILQDSRVHEVTVHNIGRIFTESYWPNRPWSGLWRPITTFSYLLNYSILGNTTDPGGYHWINIILHGANVSLVYLLGVLIFAEPWLAIIVAALWGLHPLLTESVTNIIGRADLLATFGVLAGLLCYIKASAPAERRKWQWLAGLVGAQTIGIFSKESAAVLPGLMLLYDVTWPDRDTWRHRARYYASLVAPFAIWFVLRNRAVTHLQVLPTDNPLVGAGFWTARLTAIQVIGKFLWLFIWPARLSADYSWNAIPLFQWHLASWEGAQVFLSLAVICGMLGLVFWGYRKSKPLFFFLLFFFVSLAPVSNLLILIGAIMAERFMYLPSVGLAACGAMGIWALCGRVVANNKARLRVAGLTAAVLCLACGIRTYARNPDWHDAQSLWSSTVDVVPNDAKAHMDLGNALGELPGRLQDAINEYQTALRIEPDYAEAHNDLGAALLLMPDTMPDAVAQFQTALRIKPDYSDAHNNLGIALMNEPGHVPEAIEQFEEALRDDSGNIRARTNLGVAYARVPGRLSDGISQLQAALREDPDDAETHAALADVLSHAPGRQADAVAEYEAALRIQPNDVRTHNNLGSTLAQMPGRLPDAIAQFQAAIQIDPSNAQAHRNLGIALSHVPGRLTDAISELQLALQIAPDAATERMLQQLQQQSANSR